jgi:hypothetical protein
MPTRQQMNEEGFEALITLNVEENETATGELPPSEYLKGLSKCREFNEAKKYCRYCKKASEHLTDYQ